MKTIVIYDETADNIKFFVLDGDYSYLDRIYINSNDDDDVLSDLIYDEIGEALVKMQDHFPILSEEFTVIVAGFAG